MPRTSRIPLLNWVLMPMWCNPYFHSNYSTNILTVFFLRSLECLCRFCAFTSTPPITSIPLSPLAQDYTCWPALIVLWDRFLHHKQKSGTWDYNKTRQSIHMGFQWYQWDHQELFRVIIYLISVQLPHTPRCLHPAIKNTTLNILLVNLHPGEQNVQKKSKSLQLSKPSFKK